MSEGIFLGAFGSVPRAPLVEDLMGQTDDSLPHELRNYLMQAVGVARGFLEQAHLTPAQDETVLVELERLLKEKYSTQDRTHPLPSARSFVDMHITTLVYRVRGEVSESAES